MVVYGKKENYLQFLTPKISSPTFIKNQIKFDVELSVVNMECFGKMKTIIVHMNITSNALVTNEIIKPDEVRHA